MLMTALALMAQSVPPPPHGHPVIAPPPFPGTEHLDGLGVYELLAILPPSAKLREQEAPSADKGGHVEVELSGCLYIAWLRASPTGAIIDGGIPVGLDYRSLSMIAAQKCVAQLRPR